MVQDKITIKKYNEVYIKIYAENYLLKELSDYFTFWVPNFQFSPAFKQKLWDGKIRLLDLRTNLIYYGVLPYIEKFVKDRNYELEYIDPRPDVAEEFPLVLAKKFIEELNIHSAGEKINVRSDQIEAFISAMRDKRKLLLSPTASGKSLIIYMIVMQLLKYKNYRGLIIVPRISLVHQLKTDFADYAEFIDFNVDEHVHTISEGSEKHSEKPIIISTFQSIYKLDKNYFEKFDYIIGDEAHLFTAQALKYIAESCINAKYRIGLTGSLDGTKTHKLVLEGLFGSIKQVISTKELMDKKSLAELEIKCLILKHKEENCKLLKGCEYKDEIEYLISNEQRNRFIKNLTLSLDKNTMILYDRVEKHGKILYDLIKNSKNLKNREVYFVYSKTTAEQREFIRKRFEEKDDIIVIASYGTFSTGVNSKSLHYLIFASPSKSRIRNLQSIGRSLRISKTKSKAVLYDIADDLRIGHTMNHTLKHFVKRTKIYDSEKHVYKLYKIGLDND